MKKIISFLFAIFFSILVFGQVSETKESIERHSNGQIKGKGSMIVTSKYPVDSNSSIISTATSKKIGYWEYWYENGNKMLEVFYGSKPLYINMWFSDGAQILKNGKGYYSTYKNECKNDIHANEKVVFIVSDSVLTVKQILLEKAPYIK